MSIPLNLLRVVWAMGDVIVIFFPTSLLINVDLPTFGLPNTQTKPDLNSEMGYSPINTTYF